MSEVPRDGSGGSPTASPAVSGAGPISSGAAGLRGRLGARRAATMFDVSFYTEQLLTVWLGLSWPSPSSSRKSRPSARLGAAGAIVSLGSAATSPSAMRR